MKMYCICTPHFNRKNELILFRGRKPVSTPKFWSPGVIGDEVWGNISSWGGGSWYDATDRKWYMFATELADHCGVDTWTTNSRTIRASSASADGLYEREAVVVPIWSHEVEVTRGDNGEYVAGLQKFGGRNGFPPPEKNELVLF